MAAPRAAGNSAGKGESKSAARDRKPVASSGAPPTAAGDGAPEASARTRDRSSAYKQRFLTGALSSAALCCLVAWFISEDRAEDTNGGWKEATAEELLRFGSGVCTVDRLSIDDVTHEVFDRLYRYRKPLIIKFPNGTRQWCDVQQWTARSIRNVYGNWNITTGKAVELVYSGGKPDTVETFGKFMDEMRKCSKSADPWYLFDRTFYPTSNLPKSIRLPSFLFTNEDTIFFLGSTGTGATFHKHMPAWNGVVFGRKRWFLYPIDKTPPGGLHGYNTASWLLNVYPHLSDADKPIECIQEAGEIFYVPESYYHAVLNLGETIAVSLQLRSAVTELETRFYKAMNLAFRATYEEDEPEDAKDLESRVKLLKESQRVYTDLHLAIPGNTEVLFELASVFSALKSWEKAEKLYKRIISMDRFYVKAYLALAFWYEDKKMEAEQEQMYRMALEANPDSKETWREYAALLLHQERFSEASKAYAKHVSLADVETSEGVNSGRMQRSLDHMLGSAQAPRGHRGPKVTGERRRDNAWRSYSLT